MPLFRPELFARRVCISYIGAIGIIGPGGLAGSPQLRGRKPLLDVSWLHAPCIVGTSLADLSY
jgi:hypothetical protein